MGTEHRTRKKKRKEKHARGSQLVGGGGAESQSFQPCCKSRRLLALCYQGYLEVTFIDFRKGNKKKPTRDSSPRVPRTLVPRRRSGKGPGNLFLTSTATRGLLDFELAHIYRDSVYFLSSFLPPNCHTPSPQLVLPHPEQTCLTRSRANSTTAPSTTRSFSDPKHPGLSLVSPG